MELATEITKRKTCGNDFLKRFSFLFVVLFIRPMAELVPSLASLIYPRVFAALLLVVARFDPGVKAQLHLQVFEVQNLNTWLKTLCSLPGHNNHNLSWAVGSQRRWQEPEFVTSVVDVLYVLVVVFILKSILGVQYNCSWVDGVHLVGLCVQW
jgi:hypothetical protein